MLKAIKRKAKEAKAKAQRAGANAKRYIFISSLTLNFIWAGAAIALAALLGAGMLNTPARAAAPYTIKDVAFINGVLPAKSVEPPTQMAYLPDPTPPKPAKHAKQPTDPASRVPARSPIADIKGE